MTPTPASEWKCPDCGGRWLDSFRFDHAVTGCSIRDQEDATQQADVERMWSRTSIERPATHAETELAEIIAGYSVIPPAQFRQPDQPAPISKPVMTTVTKLAPGIHRRVVAGIDPDALKIKERAAQ